MVKSFSVVLLFVIHCLLNIYEGIVMSASPMAAHFQHARKNFALSLRLYCSTTYKTHFVIKQAVKLNGFTPKQYQRTAPLNKTFHG